MFHEFRRLIWSARVVVGVAVEESVFELSHSALEQLDDRLQRQLLLVEGELETVFRQKVQGQLLSVDGDLDRVAAVHTRAARFRDGLLQQLSHMQFLWLFRDVEIN
jgi:hypothetical protein